MTTPAPPPEPQPAAAPQEAPQPPAAPSPPEQPGGEPAGDIRRLARALEEERARHRETQQALSALQDQHMSAQDRAVAEAKAQGRAEAAAEAALKLAAAEFRFAAAGRIADPAAALDLIDVSKLLNADGEPDAEMIAAVIDRLAPPAAPPGAALGGRVPAGPRQPAGDDGDSFMRGVLRRGGR